MFEIVQLCRETLEKAINTLANYNRNAASETAHLLMANIEEHSLTKADASDAPTEMDAVMEEKPIDEAGANANPDATVAEEVTAVTELEAMEAIATQMAEASLKE